MDLEAGPVRLLDPDRVLPPRLTFGFEALAGQTAQQIEGTRERLAGHLATMAGNLSSGPTSGLEEAIARAAGEHASQIGAEPLSFAGNVTGAELLSDELNFVRGHFPPDGSTPGLPNVDRNDGNVFEGATWPDDFIVERPTGGGGGGGGEEGGGGGGGGSADPEGDSVRARLPEYLERHPEQRPRVERFLQDNPNDYARMPRALELPDW